MGQRVAWGLSAALLFGLAAVLAAWHPLSPAWALAGVLLAALLAAWRPRAWLFVLPAALPLASLAPWTGWQAVDEFDLLLFATLAGGYARLAGVTSAPSADPLSRSARVLVAALAGSALLALGRGWIDAGGGLADLDPFQGADQPFNAWRVGKAPLQALLMLPLIGAALQHDRDAALRRLTQGMLAGLTVVALATLAERAAYPGLLNFNTLYRTTALFWEMHVGGAAIDAYFALAVPFVAWALWSAHTPRQWAVAAAVALLAAYACLTTFSRGAYVAALLPLLLVGLVLALRARDPGQRRARGAWALGTALSAAVAAAALVFVEGGAGLAAALAALGGWCALAWFARARLGGLGLRRLASLGLATALLTEAFGVLGTGSLMLERFAASEGDAHSRGAHWRAGVALLEGPGDWAFGLGAGRLPAHYARTVPGGEFSGSVRLDTAVTGAPVLRLAGPTTRPELGGLHGLTQRVPIEAERRHRVRLELRTDRPTVLALRLCESHLLYDRACQRSYLRLPARGTGWQNVTLALGGSRLSPGRWWAPRQGVFTLSVLDAGSVVELRHVDLLAPDGRGLLRNTRFGDGLAHWWPAAQVYFIPWHIDNLYLEWLVERGVWGLAAFLTLAGWALRWLGRPGTTAAAPFLAAAIVGGLTVGLVSSLMDVPRVAWLWMVIVLLGLRLKHAGDGTAR